MINMTYKVNNFEKKNDKNHVDFSSNNCGVKSPYQIYPTIYGYGLKAIAGGKSPKCSLNILFCILLPVEAGKRYGVIML